MSYLLRKMLTQGGYMNPANDDGGSGAGGGGGNPDPADQNKGDKDDKGDRSGEGDKSGSKDDSGGKKPTDEEARLLKEVMKKKEDLKRTQDELAALKKSVEGLDLDAVKKLLAEQKTTEEKALEAKGDYERLKARMAEEHSKEVTTLKAQLAELQSQLTKATGTIDDLTVGSQFGQSTFINAELTLTPGKARVIYGNYFDVQDGQIVGYDKPRGAANRTALVDQYGQPVGFDAALRKIVEADPEKDHLLKSKIKPGAGSDSKRASSTVAKDVPTDSMGKIAAGLKALKLPVA